ncbi:hypothetical protein ABEB36_003446 [Hypothenemus hampei]|uniref:PID domain-containing protein n=1 Tax=Hypothenemus hampei TaxID=57062 RepID=A0ABD1F961_HYPHA
MDRSSKELGPSYDQKFIKKKISFPMFNETSRKTIPKDKTKSFKYVFNKIRLKKCASATISKPFPTYHVAYLGNVLTGWAKGEGCIEKPLTTLWRNYIQSSRPDVNMHLTVSGGGLKAVTKNHGLTEYWAHRLTTCAAPAEFPRIFCWVYRHEGRRLRHELRCHAVLCASTDVATQIEKQLKEFLCRALTDFKKEKLSRQNARLSLVNSINENGSLPRRKILLGIGCHNYRPPLECSKSAPKLSSIQEIFGEEEIDGDLLAATQRVYKNILKTYERGNSLSERGIFYTKRKLIVRTKNQMKPEPLIVLQESINNRKESVENHTNNQSVCDTTKDHCVSFGANTEIIESSLINPNQTILDLVEDKAKEIEKKIDLDFKIGGEVLPAIKDKIPNIDHAYVNPILSKGLMEQEQVSLVPVGETFSDFSSLKVYKKRNVPETGKDFSCAMFLSGENVTHLEHIFQTHCSFSSERSEDDIGNKINSTLTV